MNLLLVGISHRTAPVDLRERVDFQVRGVDRRAARAGRPRVDARSGRGLDLQPRGAVRRLRRCRGDARRSRRASSASSTASRRRMSRRTSTTSTASTRRGICSASPRGLDSLVVGEPQILGQVKDAHTAAAEAQTVGPVLNRLFHSSFAVGKRVRTETGLGSGAVSVSYAAASLARKIFGDLRGRSVAVVGAGEMGKLTALHMKSQGVQHVTIVSRTMAHAARTAEAIGGASAAPWDELDAVLGASDIVITATGAAAPILTKAHVEAVMRPRRNRPLFIIDIAVPRDVEAGGRRNRAGVSLQHRRSPGDRAREPGAPRERGRARRSDRRRRGRASSARGSDRAARFPPSSRCASGSKTSAAPSSSGWTSSCRRCRPTRAARVDEITHLIVEKLLLTPTEQLKSLGDSDTVGAYAEALTRLFDLADAERRADGERSRAEPRGRGNVEAVPSQPVSIATLTPWIRNFDSARAAASSRCGRRIPWRRASPPPAGRPAASSSSGPPAIACRTRRCPRSAASGCSSRKSRTRCFATRSISRCTAARTCRRCCRTALRSARVLPREDPARRRRITRRWPSAQGPAATIEDLVARSGRVAIDRHRQRPAHCPADAAVPRRRVPADSRQSGYAVAQAR